ncbi:hypothetical protein CMI37_16710 [Candidatus Pacearchaeota archaeon]|jgi:hypothetical protein|nr:hypothetical protein [Candidatus Pacearchaeota archaeon]|tara:strand:- start:5776 stop:6639 length:864 start_codon:yes stop_codon:yes gene_type:complete
MNKPLLTIGMATFDDFHGVYFSIQALRMYHPEIMDETEIIIIDNNPDSAHGKECSNLKGHCPNLKYIPFTEYKSTVVRNQIFEQAQGDFVVSMDCHVLFEPGSLKRLLDFYKQDPTTDNLHQGPLVYDDLKNISTHFDPVWREQMYGIWQTDERGKDPNGEPFEIPMQGLGIFSCRKEAWLGFNKNFRGFGGEEGYIHEKFRQNGKKCLCLPFLRWVHRFGRPDGVKYPLTMENKLRNYFIGHFELGLSVEPIIEHFSRWKQRGFLEKIAEESKKVALPALKAAPPG